MEMSRRVLGGPGDEGRAPYQVLLTTCDHCGRTWQEGRGEAIEVGQAVAERAACDAQHIGRVASVVGVSGEAHVGSEPGVDAAVVGEAHVGSEPSMEAPAGLAGQAHVGSRASQTIPPAIRRLVLRRDGRRCRVPGCRNTNWLDIHHTTTRAEGGTHDVDGLLTACGVHHDLVHRGFLIITGRAPNFVFEHADGTPYGGAVSPAAAEAGAEAFSALRNLGLGDGEAKRALARARERAGAGAGTEALIRAALKARGETLLPPRVDETREPSPGPRSYPTDGTSGTGGVREPSPAYGPGPRRLTPRHGTGGAAAASWASSACRLRTMSARCPGVIP